MTTDEQFLAVATKAAKDSGKIFRKYFGAAEKVTKKDGNKYNLVSSADIAIEKQIRKIITARFPGHEFLGEENGWGKNKSSQYKWIVDPIDGTTNFIQGVPFCSTSVGLWDEKGPLVGVICDPLHDKLYQARRGNGAKLNNKKITVSKVAKLGDAFGGFGWNEAYDPSVQNSVRLGAKIISSARKSRALASTVLQLAYVAAGIFDFYVVNAIKPWDFAASALLITEAGGRVTDWEGRPPTIETKNLIASNGKIHNELLEKVKNPA